MFPGKIIAGCFHLIEVSSLKGFLKRFCWHFSMVSSTNAVCELCLCLQDQQWENFL